jgi:hypothetical protein
LAHARQRKLGGEKKPIVFGACTGAPQEFKHRALRKFGRAAQAAIDRISMALRGIGSLSGASVGQDPAPWC